MMCSRLAVVSLVDLLAIALRMELALVELVSPGLLAVCFFSLFIRTCTDCDTDQCQDGFFGPNCQPCNCSNGETCSEGIIGSGLCTAPAQNITTAADTCNCLNGVCDGSNTCACNAGWADASNSGQRCSVCDEGFALSNGECLGKP